MKLEETKQILKKLRIAYTYAYEKKTNEELQDILDLWNDELKYYDYNFINKSVDNWIKTNAFAPRIADLICKKQSNFTQRVYPERIF